MMMCMEVCLGLKRRGFIFLNFAKAFELVVANLSFPKKENHLVTFCCLVAKTQTDTYFLGRVIEAFFLRTARLLQQHTQ
uniref:Putative ovule protein n=1 Tax=Solanum chacoense TaxID=4108 RepID=A0A0V0GM19_SOLCH